MRDITVAFGPGPSSARALQWGARRAERSGTTLHLIRVVDDGQRNMGAAAIAAALASGRTELDGAQARLRREHPKLDVEVQLLRGDLLLTLASVLRPDGLLVVGVAGVLGWGGRGMSVAARLVGHPAGPIAVVPDLDRASGRRVVAGVDPRDDGARVASFAAEEAAGLRQRLHVVSAWSRTPPVTDDRSVSGEPLLTAIGRAHPELTIEHTRAHKSGLEALLDATVDASLLVIGAPRYTGWRRFVHGSVAAELVLEVELPMIVVPVASSTVPTASMAPAAGRSALHPRTGGEQTAAMSTSPDQLAVAAEPVRTTEPAEQQAAVDRASYGGSIVVGVDGSMESIAALRAGARLAELLDAPVEAILAWQFPNVSYAGYPAFVDWAPDDDARGLLTALVTEVFGTEPPSRFAAATRLGAPARVLIDAARLARLLVVGGRGHGGFAGLLLGSVSESVTRHAPCPVLVLHGAEADGLDAPTGAGTRPIIVGVDGSPASVEALRQAVELAAAFDCPLEVILAWHPPTSFSGYPLALTWSPEEDARSALQDCLHTVFGDDLPPHVVGELREGRAADVLLHAAERARLLVVGARGHGGFERMLLGSATETCVRHSPAPVLVVPDAAARAQRIAATA